MLVLPFYQLRCGCAAGLRDLLGDLIPQLGHVPDRVGRVPPQQIEHPGQVFFTGSLVLL